MNVHTVDEQFVPLTGLVWKLVIRNQPKSPFLDGQLVKFGQMLRAKWTELFLCDIRNDLIVTAGTGVVLIDE